MNRIILAIFTPFKKLATYEFLLPSYVRQKSRKEKRGLVPVILKDGKVSGKVTPLWLAKELRIQGKLFEVLP